MASDTARCPVCENGLHSRLCSSIVRDGTSYSLVYCRDCDVAVTSPAPTKHSLDYLYSSERYRDGGTRFVGPVEQAVRRWRAGRLRRVERIAKKGRLLDVGCGRGTFLSMAQDRGWKVHGTEYNDETASFARGIGLLVTTGEKQLQGLPDSHFDVVTIWHVFEHMPRPNDVLAECRRIIIDGGLLVVAVPNLRSVQARLFRDAWFHLDVPHHLYHYSDASLAALLRRHGFTLLDCRHQSLEFGPYGVLQSWLNTLCAHHNHLYGLLQRSPATSSPRGWRYHLDTITSLAVGVPSFPGSVAWALAESAVGRGGVVEVFARNGVCL